MKKRAAVLLLLAACQTSSTRDPQENAPKVGMEVLFQEPDHKTAWCQKKDAADAFAQNPDGTIFFDAGSVLRIRVPSAPGQVPYHAHLYHRPNSELAEVALGQGTDGIIHVDLSKHANPEMLLVASATVKMHAPEAKQKDRTLPLLGPYALSFRLVPRDQASILTPLQPFRYEWKHPEANVSLFVQSFNRSDMLLTLSDPDQGADFLFADSAVRWKAGDATLIPRVVVDVATAGKTWFRAGTYPVPDAAWAEPSAFDLNLAGIEMIPFSPPARVDLMMLDERPATSLRIGAKFTGLPAQGSMRFVLSSGHPIEGNEKVRVKVQTLDVTKEKPETSFLVDYSDLDQGQFPLTGYVSHRFVQAWRTSGGLWSPCEPLGRFEGGVAREAARAVHAPVYASHCSLITLLGKGKNEAELPLFLAEYLSPKNAKFVTPLPVPWNPVSVGVIAVPVPTLPTFPTVPTVPSTGVIAVPANPVNPPPTWPSLPVSVAIALVRNQILPISVSTQPTLATATVVTAEGLRNVQFRIERNGETRVQPPEGLQTLKPGLDDPNTANAIYQRARASGTPFHIRGRAMFASSHALWAPEISGDWLTAYRQGIKKEESKARDGGQPVSTGFDYWPGVSVFVRPPKAGDGTP